MLSMEAANRPLALFEPGSPISFKSGADKSQVIVCVDNKIGEDQLHGVVLYKTGADGKVLQEINAERGKITANEDIQELSIDLFNCVFSDHSNNESSEVKRAYSEYFNFKYNYGKQANAKRISILAKYMPLRELLAEIRRFKALNKDTTELEVELNQRIAFALSPIAFLLLGMPLAIRTSRRETSIGLFISVILAGTFFLSIILCESFVKFPNIYPQYLLWLPNIIFQLLGGIMTYRISQR
jgi:lipopolysaccharide export LptBFGC system permease protein LptF